MNKRDRGKFEKLLLAERDRVGGHIREIENTSRHETGRESGGDLASYADVGTDSFGLETALNIASGESEWLIEINEALQRLREGTYGICEGCEKPIPKLRLEAFPSARHCVACQSEIEKNQALR